MAEQPVRAKELRAASAADLQEQLRTLRQELWQLRVKVTDGSLQHSHQLRVRRRQIARVLTVLRERPPSQGAVHGR